MPEVISRDNAHQLGRRRFYTGLPCRRGHIAERYVINGVCVDCAMRKPIPGPDPNRHRNVRPVALAFYCDPLPTAAELTKLGARLNALANKELVKMRMDDLVAPLPEIPENIGELTPEQKEAARVEEAWDTIWRNHGEELANAFRAWLVAGWTPEQLEQHGHIPPLR